MRPFVSVEAAGVQEDSLRRERTWFYPVEAIREALLNALVHRDWTRLPEVEVVSYSDRLEITSPGALQNSMTVEKMLAGQRSPRNPVLVEVMRDYYWHRSAEASLACVTGDEVSGEGDTARSP
jgi:ATP-dependent DNA helicase RecG